ncbi:DsrE family protein [Maribacter sp. 2307ULW6-5]|uniref:DsrE family protein n=1 Tax=Maribacter sp. 2307ULW6-5 TaxID=3386275 RepID=UPI0039BCDF0E
MKKTTTALRWVPALLIITACTAFAQEKKAGPIIANYGQVWEINAPDFKTDTAKTYRAVFDVMTSPEDPAQRNPSLETAARFLNMHAQSGVPQDQLKVALVVHNKASKDLAHSAAYKKRYGVQNPNAQMLTDLMAAGVQVIFCGQSSLSRGFPKEDLLDGVQISLSAMTALIQLQDEGYRFIKF